MEGCPARSDEWAEKHCVHDIGGTTEAVCCWCGDLFEADAEHGKYAPLLLTARGSEAT